MRTTDLRNGDMIIGYVDDMMICSVMDDWMALIEPL